MPSRRLAALAALALTLVALTAAIALAVSQFPRGLVGLAVLAAAGASGWVAILHRRGIRVLGLLAAVGLGVAAVVLLLGRAPLLVLAAAGALWLALAAARDAFRPAVRLPPAPRPRRPVLIYNPRSGDGKAERFRIAEEAHARGIEPIALEPGDDLAQLARDAVARGADALAMAGGDGSQALIAGIAAAHELPYACIPTGTRNHFALDLGVDRDDPVGALDALVDGGERLVDLAEVNGRVFVNNVSLGVYAEAVQRRGYRDAKIRTLLDTAPDAVGQAREDVALTWDGQRRAPARDTAMVLVSNNRYRLGSALGSGTRPRLDTGALGVTAVTVRDRAFTPSLREWTTTSFRVDATEPVPAGVDGESVLLDPPLVFRTRPRALRVRIAPSHPGASPSSVAPKGPGAGVRALLETALGRESPAALTAPENARPEAEPAARRFPGTA